MAVIQPYEQRYSAQGALTTNATGDDFGAQIGRANAAKAESAMAISNAISNVGKGMVDVGQAMYQNEVNDEVTNIHVSMSQKRAEWQQKLTDMTASTKPGDQSLAPRVMDGMKQEFEDMGQTLKTRQGRETFARLSADMTSMFGQEAVAAQSRLDGEFAKNQYKSLVTNAGSVAAKDYTKVETEYANVIAAIDDPHGKFARVPEPTREAFKQQAKEEIDFAAAKGFARAFPNAVLGRMPENVRTEVQKVVANPPTPGLPPDLKAPIVKPYDQKKIDYVAKTVSQPSPYDKVFQDAARLHNLDWRELKMRAVVESNLNPTAQSQQNAGGIMQFTPETAKQLGVDRMDPVASINAAAKLIAGYRSKAGGDMSKVDMMYYGGEGGKAWGPNTKQYAANMAAARGAVGLGTSVAPEQFAASPVVQAGDSQGWVKPTTGIGFIDNLPADKFFSVLTEAEHYQRAYDSQAERTRIEQKRQQQDAAEQVMDQYTQRIVNPTKQNGGSLNEVEVVSNPALNSTQKQHILGYMSQYAREQQARMEPKTNPANVRELMLRIHAPDSDSAKIYNNEPIYQALTEGRISTSEFAYLNKEVTELRSSSTNGFRRDVNNMRGQVARALQQNIQLQAMEMANPGTIADISYRFDRDLEARIDALRKENKDPSTLLDPTSKDYVLRQGRLQQFFPSNTVGQSAAAAVVAQAPQLPTYKDYDTLPKGASYTDPQGNVRVKR